MNVNVTSVEKTLLWSNPNPNVALASQSINLNNDLAKFSHILIQWKTDISQNIIYEDIFKITPYREGCGTEADYGLIGKNNDGSRMFARSVYCPNYNNELFITDACSIGEDKTNNNKNILVYIYGLNFSY